MAEFTKLLCCGSDHRPLDHRPLRSVHAYIGSTVVMWMLEAQSLGSSDERSVRVQTIRHYLTAGSHVVGRNITAGQSNIIVEEDKSISRGHAVITVEYAGQVRFKVKGAFCHRLKSLTAAVSYGWEPACLVTPDTSRYGTLVNKVELKGAETHLQEGDFIQFGHKSSFRLLGLSA